MKEPRRWGGKRHGRAAGFGPLLPSPSSQWGTVLSDGIQISRQFILITKSRTESFV